MVNSVTNTAKNNRIFSITIVAILTIVLVIQEYLLSFLPNIQLTVLLLFVYSKTIKTKRTLLVILIYVVLDGLIMGTLNIVYLPFIFIAWSLIPILLGTVFRKIEHPIILAIIAFFMAIAYCLIYLIPQVLIFKVDIWAYLIADLPFELILACSSFISVLWLYKPLKRVIDNFNVTF